MSIGQAAAGDHIGICGYCGSVKSFNVLGLCCICGPCCLRVPCLCPFSVLPPKTMLRSIEPAEVRDKVVVHSLYCHQKPSGIPWSVLPLTGKKEEATFVMISMTVDRYISFK